MNSKELTDNIFKFIIGKLAELTETPELSLQITTSTNLQEVGLDSVGLIRIIVELEKKYSIAFDDGEMIEDNFKTIEQISKNILGKLSIVDKEFT